MPTTEWTPGKPQRSHIDRGWAWVVLCASFFSLAIVWGQVFSFTIYYVIFLQLFGESRSYTAWIGSLNLAVIQIAAITAGFFISRLGARRTSWLGSSIASLGYVGAFFSQNVTHLLFTYGIIVAFGFCLCVYGVLEAISQYFKKYLYVATGITVTGGGIGILCYGYIVDWLIETYGWRGSLLIQGACAFQIFAIATLFFPINENVLAEQKANDSERNQQRRLKTWNERIKDPRVTLYGVGGLLQGVGLLNYYIILKDLAISKGLGSAFATTMMALGIGNVVGRAASGLIISWVSPILYVAAILALCSCVLFIHILNNSPKIFIILGGLFGYGHGSLSTVNPLLVAFMLGRREIAPTFGFMVFFAGLGTLFGPPIAGYLTDTFGSYSSSLAMSGGFLVAATALSIALHYCHRKRTLKEETKKTVSILINPIRESDDKAQA